MKRKHSSHAERREKCAVMVSKITNWQCFLFFIFAHRLLKILSTINRRLRLHKPNRIWHRTLYRLDSPRATPPQIQIKLCPVHLVISMLRRFSLGSRNLTGSLYVQSLLAARIPSVPSAARRLPQLFHSLLCIVPSIKQTRDDSL